MENKSLKDMVLEWITSLLSKNKGTILENVNKSVSNEVSKPVDQIQMSVLDWNDQNSKISKYFTVKEAIMLRTWNRLANAEDGLNDKVKENLIEIFKVMDVIREHLNKPLIIKSAYRPSAYNVAIGGAKLSAHMATEDYAAVDFWCDETGDGQLTGEDCDAIKDLIRPMLEQWNIRMEINGKGARWVHIDNKPVPKGGSREFNP